MRVQTILIEVEDPLDPTLQEYLKGMLEAWYDRKIEIIDDEIILNINYELNTMSFTYRLGRHY
jgi:hypothetical protein